jgi:hypothetical protein
MKKSMLITTSRRPGYRSRRLGRELAMVIPGARYVPRGTKTLEKLASMAESLGRRWVMIIGSSQGNPRKLLFFSSEGGRRWSNKKIELGDVRLQHDGRIDRLDEIKIYAEGSPARELANFLAEVLGVPIQEEPPETGAALLVTSNPSLTMRFQRSGSEVTGPSLQVLRFG